MKDYLAYMDAQQGSETLHARLLALSEGEIAPKTTVFPQKRRQGGHVMKFTALAACAALIFGLGWNGLGIGKPPVDPVVPPAVTDGETTPVPTPTPDNGQGGGFVAAGPGDEADKLAFPAIFGVNYTDTTYSMDVAASLAFPEGSFWVDLNKEDIQKIFWGKEGKPAVENPKTDTGDFPLFLMDWQGYTITGTACYDGSGDLYRLAVNGVKGEDSFTFTLCPGMIPPECCIDPDLVTTTVGDLEVTGSYRSYDCDGDGKVEHMVTASFMAGDYGITFRNIGFGGRRASETDGGEATELGGAQLFNAMLVNHFCRRDGQPYLDHLLRNENIPAWTEEGYDTLGQALAGAEQFTQSHPRDDFLPYLPTQGPRGYGEFYGHLSYQEGHIKELWVRWSVVGGYDNVEVEVRLPEGDSTDYYREQLVDVNVPESYDWRLYEGSISDSVPEEYRMAFYKPTFRAQDMSLEVVRARMRDHDTGGEICHFYVLHDNGTVVGYDCAGVSAEYVWSLVEGTLN